MQIEISGNITEEQLKRIVDLIREMDNYGEGEDTIFVGITMDENVSLEAAERVMTKIEGDRPFGFRKTLRRGLDYEGDMSANQIIEYVNAREEDDASSKD